MATTIIADPKSPNIRVGRQGENKVTDVIFPLDEFQGLGPGTVHLMVRRKGDEAEYLAPVTVEGKQARWTLTSADLQNNGYSDVQLMYLVNDQVAKSQQYALYVEEAMGMQPGPSPDMPYLEKVAHEADRAAEAAAGAATSQNAAAETLAEIRREGETIHQDVTAFGPLVVRAEAAAGAVADYERLAGQMDATAAEVTRLQRAAQGSADSAAADAGKTAADRTAVGQQLTEAQSAAAQAREDRQAAQGAAGAAERAAEATGGYVTQVEALSQTIAQDAAVHSQKADQAHADLAQLETKIPAMEEAAGTALSGAERAELAAQQAQVHRETADADAVAVEKDRAQVAADRTAVETAARTVAENAADVHTDVTEQAALAAQVRADAQQIHRDEASITAALPKIQQAGEAAMAGAEQAEAAAVQTSKDRQAVAGDLTTITAAAGQVAADKKTVVESLTGAQTAQGAAEAAAGEAAAQAGSAKTEADRAAGAAQEAAKGLIDDASRAPDKVLSSEETLSQLEGKANQRKAKLLLKIEVPEGGLSQILEQFYCDPGMSLFIRVLLAPTENRSAGMSFSILANRYGSSTPIMDNSVYMHAPTQCTSVFVLNTNGVLKGFIPQEGLNGWTGYITNMRTEGGIVTEPLTDYVCTIRMSEGYNIPSGSVIEFWGDPSVEVTVV